MKPEDIDQLPYLTMSINRPIVSKPDHPQVAINGVNVDEGMAELLQRLWMDNYLTQWSCQGDSALYHISARRVESAYIVFVHADDAYRFLKQATSFITDVQDMMHMELSMMTDGRAAVNFPPWIVQDLTEGWWTK